MSTANKLLQAASGGAGDPIYVEDVFAIRMYDGNGSSNTINNGIDLAGEGGFLWVKYKDGGDHQLFDTVRGVNKYLMSNQSTGQTTDTNIDLTFNSNGFTFDNNEDNLNNSSGEYVSWAWRKQEKFFDVVTYTGNNTGQAIAHNLGSVPGMILIKRYDFGDDWIVYHRGAHSSSPQNYALKLNEQNQRNSSSSWFNNTAPTATHFTVGSSAQVSQGGASFVAYLFAHNEAEFGKSSDKPIIHIGNYTGNGNSGAGQGPTVTVGFRPQWVLLKATSRDGQWWMFQTTTNIATRGRDYKFYANDHSGLTNGENICLAHSNGFRIDSTSDSEYNSNGEVYTYVAIAEPQKPVDYGTEMFTPVSYTGDQSGFKTLTASHQVDWALIHQNNATSDGRTHVVTRITGGSSGSDSHSLLRFSDTSAGAGIATINWERFQTGIQLRDQGDVNRTNAATTAHLFKRSPEVFDIVSYVGTGSQQDVTHHLGVVPEAIIIKRINSSSNWRFFYDFTSTNYDRLEINSLSASSENNAYSSDNLLGAQPTATTFTPKTNNDTNASLSFYNAYLFATKAGVSKVVKVTHNNSSTTDVDCGFSSGARFVMLKRTDASSDWRVFDSVTGIVAGNESFIRWNVDGANLTNDYVAPLSSGIQLTTYLDSGTYIILAFA